MTTEIFNFSAGPAVLPQAVLAQAQAELLDWHGSGMSVMEMSHRGHAFMQIAAEAQQDLRDLMQISDDYHVLFLQGGAHLQFSMVPLNLLRERHSADYLNTGIWSEKAIEEAKKFCQVNVVASAQYAVPDFTQWQCQSDAAYLHITSNETIQGVEIADLPTLSDLPTLKTVPLVCDMSSHILSRPVDVSRYGLIYAGAQKNIGPAGLTIVIVRKDLIGHAASQVPAMLDYAIHAQQDSMYNTPPTYAIYMAGLVFKWLKQQGGLAAMEQINIAKSQLLYDYLDASDFYHSPVAHAYRSRMNVPFTLSDAGLESAFLQGAEQQGLLQLKGHKLVGGMRASLYNAMPIAGVEKLLAYMQQFAKQHG